MEKERKREGNGEKGKKENKVREEARLNGRWKKERKPRKIKDGNKDRHLEERKGKRDDIEERKERTVKEDKRIEKKEKKQGKERQEEEVREDRK